MFLHCLPVVLAFALHLKHVTTSPFAWG